MKFTPIHVFIIGLVALLLGGAGTAGFMYRVGGAKEGLLVRVGGAEGFEDSPVCRLCGNMRPCGCRNGKSTCPPPAPVAPCPRVQEPDLSKYILKSQIPSSKIMPDMTNYMMKSECPPVPDLSKYVLRSSIPKPQPVIIDNSKCGNKDIGDCPPCPRPRCAPVICPKPVQCPIPAPCPRPVCKPSVVKCKAEEESNSVVRPFLSPLSMSGFGSA
jgi:hypothetical protein